MPSTRIDRDEFDRIADELSGSDMQRAGDIIVITGNHEDHGRVTLRREAGMFTVSAESLEFVRPWGVAGERVEE